MFGTIAVLVLIILANVSAQSNSSCVQVVDSTAAGVSPYPDDEPSLTFMMEGATNLKTNTVSFFENVQFGRGWIGCLCSYSSTHRLIYSRPVTERLFSGLVLNNE